MSKKDKLDLLQPHKKKRRTYTGPPHPAPEVIDGGEWTVVESPTVRIAGVQKNPVGPGGKIVVPLGKGEAARLIRAHELTHIHITPTHWPRDYDDRVMNLLEDGRVHKHMISTGFDLEPVTEVIEEAELTVEELSKCHPAVLASLVIGLVQTGEEERIRQAILDLKRPDILHVADRLYDATYGSAERPDVDMLGHLADEIMSAFGDPNEPEPEDEELPPGEEPKEEPPVPPEMKKYPVPPKKHEPTFGKEKYGWGKMEITEAPLTRRLPGKMRGRRRIVPDHRGRRLRRVGRLHVDGKVFGSRPPMPGGGAVLIDVSGSMGLTSEQVELIVQALPGGIVASYAGWDGSRSTGELKIIAKNGRYCDRRDIIAGAGLNIIDGPALEWLGKQRGPRYWVSDGRVTGIGEQQNPVLIAQVDRICKQFQITRVRDMSTLLGS